MIHAALTVRHRTVALSPACGGRQQDVRHLRRLRHADLLHDEVVETLEAMPHVVRVGVGLRRVLTDHIQGGEILPIHCPDHLGEVPAFVWLELHVPVLLETFADLRLEHRLEPGEAIRDRAHVAAALNVVLAA
jgi:hypothetical protein